MTGSDPRMSSSSQVGLTGLFRLTTIVVSSGVDMLVIVVGKLPGTNGAQSAGDALTAASVSSNVNSTSLAVSGWPSDHFQGLTVIVIVLPPFDHTGALTGLSASSTVGVEPLGAKYIGRQLCHSKV